MLPVSAIAKLVGSLGEGRVCRVNYWQGDASARALFASLPTSSPIEPRISFLGLNLWSLKVG